MSTQYDYFLIYLQINPSSHPTSLCSLPSHPVGELEIGSRILVSWKDMGLYKATVIKLVIEKRKIKVHFNGKKKMSLIPYQLIWWKVSLARMPQCQLPTTKPQYPLTMLWRRVTMTMMTTTRSMTMMTTTQIIKITHKLY